MCLKKTIMNYKNMCNKNYRFVSLKSFGDLVIASKHLEMLFDEDKKKVRLWVGNYHSDLISALQLKLEIEVIDLKHKEIPACYNVKNKGLKRSVLSLIELRKFFKSHYNDGDTLVFDQLNFREKYLAFGMNKISLVKN
jgi:hypothetical protein